MSDFTTSQVLIFIIIGTMCNAISFSCIMNMISHKAKITKSRIKKTLLYAVIAGGIIYLTYGLPNRFIIVIFNGVVIISFLYQEKTIVKKIHKLLLLWIIMSIVESIVNIGVDWIYYNLLKKWYVYELGVSVIVCLVIMIATIVIKCTKIFEYTNEEGIIYSTGEEILLCIMAFTAMTSISSIFVAQQIAPILLEHKEIIIYPYLNAIVTVIVILRIDKSIAEKYYRRVNQLLEKQFKNQMSYYEKIEESHQEIRTIRHDMKNHLIVMESLLENKEYNKLDEYIDSIKQTVSKQIIVIQTGNMIIDAILNEKNQSAQEKNIEVKFDLQNLYSLTSMDIEAIDLSVMLGNSIDNAIEACERIEDIEKRLINIRMIYKAGYFICEITNSMKEKNLHRVKGKLITLKKDKKNHGLGMASIEQRVKKYDGIFKTISKDYQFKVIIEINTKNLR